MTAAKGSDSLENLALQVQEAISQVESSRDALALTVTALDGMMLHPGPSGYTGSEEASQEAVRIVVEQSARATAEIENEVAGAIAAQLVLVVEGTSQLHDQGTQWDQAAASALNGAMQLQQDVELSAKTLVAALLDLRGRVEAAHAAVTQREAAFADEAQRLTGTVEELFGEGALAAARDAYNDIQGVQTGRATEELASSFSLMGSAIGELQRGGETAMQLFQSAALEALRALASDVSTGIERQLDAAGQQLIRDVLERVATTFAAALATSELGVEIGALVAPYLPEIILTKQATGEIKELIEVYKSMRSIDWRSLS